MNSENVAMPLKRFLLVEQCPASWNGLDLYLFRDENFVFYVGQSYLAFARVWAHLINGFKGHSMVGRFVWCNWPKSMSFTIELLSSQSEEFGEVGNDLNASERLLIQRWSLASLCHRTISQRLCQTPIYPPMPLSDAGEA